MVRPICFSLILGTCFSTALMGCEQRKTDLSIYTDDPANGGNGAGFGGADADDPAVPGEPAPGEQPGTSVGDDGECDVVNDEHCVPDANNGPVCNASTLQVGEARAARTSDAADTVGPAPCEPQTAGSPDRAVAFQAPAAGHYVFDVINANFDTVLHLRRGTCDGAVVACNDDGDDRRLTSRVVLPLAAHQTVIAVVDGFAGETGDFVLQIDRIEVACGDGTDDDEDGDVDCDDRDCSANCVEEDPWPADWIAYENALLAATNAVRVRGAVCGGREMPPVAPITMNPLLRNAARAHAMDMGENDYFDHVGLDGSTFDVRMARAGYRGRPPWGENLVAGRPSANDAIAALMNSPGHCRNIMYENFHVVGIGYVYSEKNRYGHIAGQNFGGGD